ncbi:hypothetical protein ACFXJO_03485 [Streptomyces lavendulae]|uniref:hypothetical protein n=1 Tax=Streptomyces lavendulae TaxID=1914 RepID=UPI0036801FF5
MTAHIQQPATVTARIVTARTPAQAAGPAGPEMVWVLRRWDWHDDDTTVHSTQGRGFASLAEYVKRHWSNIAHQENVPEEPPTDPRAAIRYYYGPDGDSRTEEGYSLQKKELDSPATTHAGQGITEQQALAADVAHTLFEEVRRAAERVASDDFDDYDLMCRANGMDRRDALEALKKASLPSDLINPIAEALAVLAPDTYVPRSV